MGIRVGAQLPVGRWLALAGVVSVLVSGCTDGDGSEEPPGVSGSPLPPTAVAQSTQVPTDEPSGPDRNIRPPVRPAAMDGEGIDGAIAAAHYFLEVVTHAIHSGDTASLDAIAGPECVFCESISATIRETTEDGGWYEGFDYELVDAESTLPTPDFPHYVIVGTLNQEAGTRYNSSGVAMEESEHTSVGNYLIVATYLGEAEWQFSGLADRDGK